MNLLPGLYFGFEENVGLLRTWYREVIRDSEFHEFHGGINHSLKGVLERYLSKIPYEKRLVDPKFENINFTNLAVETLQIIRYATTGLLLLLIAALCFRQQADREDRLLSYGLIACAIVMLAPSTGYNYLVILIIPSAVLSSYLMGHYDGKRIRVILGLAGAAALLSFLPPLIPGRAMQRYVQVHSPYFFSALALFAGSALALVSRRTESK
jgi:hypothetical protein